MLILSSLSVNESLNPSKVWFRVLVFQIWSGPRDLQRKALSGQYPLFGDREFGCLGGYEENLVSVVLAENVASQIFGGSLASIYAHGKATQ